MTLSFKQFRFLLLQAVAVGLLLFGLQGETKASSTPTFNIHTETAGRLAGGIYKLDGYVVRSSDVDISEFELGFTAVSLDNGSRWALPREFVWNATRECSRPSKNVCNDWHARLNTSSLPPGDYNIEVWPQIDMETANIDIFGDESHERCSYGCHAVPTCSAGLCQYGGMSSLEE